MSVSQCANKLIHECRRMNITSSFDYAKTEEICRDNYQLVDGNGHNLAETIIRYNPLENICEYIKKPVNVEVPLFLIGVATLLVAIDGPLPFGDMAAASLLVL